MESVRKSPRKGVQITEAMAAESCHFVLDTSPPDYVEKISRYLETSVEYNPQDVHASDSDSGNSLFITQKPTPKAVRLQRRHRSSKRPEDPEFDSELEYTERGDGRKEREKATRLSVYRFPFLTQRNGTSTDLRGQDNIGIHYTGIGGFLQSCQNGDSVESSLPTVDVDGEDITPLSDEEEGSDDEDIKVVQKKCFVVACKAKCPQPWCTPHKRDSQVEQQSERRGAGDATSTKKSQRRPKKTAREIKPPASKQALFSDSDITESFNRGQVENKRSDGHLKNGSKIACQASFPTNRPSQKSKMDELCDDSDATNISEYTQQDREISSTTLTADVNLSQTEQPEYEPGTGESQSFPHLIRDSCGNESRRKEKKKKKDTHRDKDEVTEAQQAVRSEDVENASGVSPEPQAVDEPELNENNQREKSLRGDNNTLGEEEGSSPLKQKKRKKNKHAAENGQQDDEGVHLEYDVTTKRKRSCEREEDVEQVSSGVFSEPEIPKKKKKSKKEKSSANTDEVWNSALNQLEEAESCLESNDAAKSAAKKKKREKKVSICDETDVSLEETAGDNIDAEAASKKKKKHKKKEGAGNVSEDGEAQSHDSVSVREKENKKASSFLAADAEGNCAPTCWDKNSPTQSVAVSGGAFVAESAETLGKPSVTEPNGEVRKKKKKKKRMTLDEDHERDFEEPDQTRQSGLPETNHAAVSKTKKERGQEGSKTDAGCMEIDEDFVVKKKKKKIKKDPPSGFEDTESEIFTPTSNKPSPRSDERSHDTKKTPLEEPGNQPLNDVTPKKKKKRTDNVSSEEKKSIAEPVEVEPRKEKMMKKMERNASPGVISNNSMLPETHSPSLFKMPSLNSVKKMSHKKVKKRLYYAGDNILT